MSVYQRKLNSKWYFEFMINGKRYHRAVPEATEKKQALKAETVFKAALLQGRLKEVERKKYISLSDLVQEHIEYAKINKIGWTNDKYMSENFLNFTGNKDINTITPQVIEKYKEFRKESVSNASVNRELQSISKMFSIAVENGWLESNPCFKVKKLRIENKLERFLTKKEEQDLFKACSGNQEYLKPIIICALHTAMRKDEILSLKWSCVKFTHNYIDVLKTKSGKSRRIPISNTLKAELKKIKKTGEYVFTNPKTLDRYSDLLHPFDRLCKKTKPRIENLRFHDLRHTAATRMVAAGIDLVVVQEILGHHNIKTTMRYAHPVPERKKAAIAALDTL